MRINHFLSVLEDGEMRSSTFSKNSKKKKKKKSVHIWIHIMKIHSKMQSTNNSTFVSKVACEITSCIFENQNFEFCLQILQTTQTPCNRNKCSRVHVADMNVQFIVFIFYFKYTREFAFRSEAKHFFLPNTLFSLTYYLFLRYERHLSWQRLLAQQLQQKQSRQHSPKDPTSSAEIPPESPRETSSNSTNNGNLTSSSSDKSLEPNAGTEGQSEVSLHDIPSTSGFQAHREVSKSADVKLEKTCETMEVDELEDIPDYAGKGEQVAPMKQREWMGESGEVCSLTLPSSVSQPQDRVDDVISTADDIIHKTNVPTIADATLAPDDAIALDSEESGEEIIIVSEDEDEKEEGTAKESDTKPEGSKEAGTAKNRTKKLVKKSDPFQIYEYLQLSFEEVIILFDRYRIFISYSEICIGHILFKLLAIEITVYCQMKIDYP